MDPLSPFALGLRDHTRGNVRSRQKKLNPLHSTDSLPAGHAAVSNQTRRWQSIQRGRQERLERLRSLERHRLGHEACARVVAGRRRREVDAWDFGTANCIPAFEQDRNEHSPALITKKYLTKRAVMASRGKRLPAFGSQKTLVDKLASSTPTQGNDLNTRPLPAPSVMFGTRRFHLAGANKQRSIKLQERHDKNRENARHLIRAWRQTPSTEHTDNDAKIDDKEKETEMDEEAAVTWWLTGGWQALLNHSGSIQSKPVKEKAPPRTQPRTPLQRFKGSLAAELGIDM